MKDLVAVLKTKIVIGVDQLEMMLEKHEQKANRALMTAIADATNKESNTTLINQLQKEIGVLRQQMLILNNSLNEQESFDGIAQVLDQVDPDLLFGILKCQFEQTGNTLLHQSLVDEKHDLFLALLVYGANPGIYNKQFDSPQSIIRGYTYDFDLGFVERLANMAKPQESLSNIEKIKFIQQATQNQVQMLEESRNVNHLFICYGYLAHTRITSAIDTRPSFVHVGRDMLTLLASYMPDKSLRMFSQTSQVVAAKTQKVRQRRKLYNMILPLSQFFTLEECFRGIAKTEQEFFIFQIATCIYGVHDNKQTLIPYHFAIKFLHQYPENFLANLVLALHYHGMQKTELVTAYTDKMLESGSWMGKFATCKKEKIPSLIQRIFPDWSASQTEALHAAFQKLNSTYGNDQIFSIQRCHSGGFQLYNMRLMLLNHLLRCMSPKEILEVVSVKGFVEALFFSHSYTHLHSNPDLRRFCFLLSKSSFIRGSHAARITVNNLIEEYPHINFYRLFGELTQTQTRYIFKSDMDLSHYRSTEDIIKSVKGGVANVLRRINNALPLETVKALKLTELNSRQLSRFGNMMDKKVCGRNLDRWTPAIIKNLVVNEVKLCSFLIQDSKFSLAGHGKSTPLFLRSLLRFDPEVVTSSFRVEDLKQLYSCFNDTWKENFFPLLEYIFNYHYGHKTDFVQIVVNNLLDEYLNGSLESALLVFDNDILSFKERLDEKVRSVRRLGNDSYANKIEADIKVRFGNYAATLLVRPTNKNKSRSGVSPESDQPALKKPRKQPRLSGKSPSLRMFPSMDDHSVQAQVDSGSSDEHKLEYVTGQGHVGGQENVVPMDVELGGDQPGVEDEQVGNVGDVFGNLFLDEMDMHLNLHDFDDPQGFNRTR